MIYFTREEQERILARFAATLPEHGALVLGRSETMTGDIRRCYQSEFPVERVYRRNAEPVTVADI
jgi:chemotaxis protein methyltransferase CheR